MPIPLTTVGCQTFATAVSVALLMTIAGSVVPALRAVRVTPMSVLKAE